MIEALELKIAFLIAIDLSYDNVVFETDFQLLQR